MFKKLFNVVSLVGNWNRILYLPGTGNIMGPSRPQASLSPTPLFLTVWTRLRERGSQFGRGDRHCGTLSTLICALCGPGTLNSVEKFERQ